MKNIANYISISRIIMSLALVIPETFSVPFYMLYIACGISDMLDGFLARKYKIVSEKGAIIDSMADVIFTLIAVIKVLPILDFSKIIYIFAITITIIKICNFILGYSYYKKIVMPHTVANKITGFILFTAPLIINHIDLAILEIVICVVATFAAIQEGQHIRNGKI